MKILKTCEWCGNDFTAFRSSQKFCSTECAHEKDKLRKRWSAKKNKVVLPEQICIICENKFTPRRKDQITCGGECARKYINSKTWDRIYAQRAVKKEIKPKKCIICNEIFTPNSYKQIICSNPVCKRIRGQDMARQRMMNKPKPVVKKTNGPSLSELAAEANRRGISYSDLVAEKDMGAICQNIAKRA